MHIHINARGGEAKIWIEPVIELAENHGLSSRQLNSVKRLVVTNEEKIRRRGENTLKAEVTNISRHGFWLLIGDEEKFVAFHLFPWFQDASVRDITCVVLQSSRHLYWPALDVDLAVESLDDPERFPLVSKVGARVADRELVETI